MNAVQNDNRPAGFPSNILIQQSAFINWDGTINAPNVWTCKPGSGEDVAAACNWAAKNGYTVRPRGSMHGWSPLAVTPGLRAYNYSKVLLVDIKGLTSRSFIPASNNKYNVPAVKTGVGVTMEDLMGFLEQQ